MAVQLRHVQVEVFGVDVRMAGGHQAIGKHGALANADAAVVQESARATAGGEQVIAAGIVNHAQGERAAHAQRNADAVLRIAVRIVGGAIQRIDDPPYSDFPIREAPDLC